MAPHAHELTELRCLALQAYQKRVYAVRDFYQSALKGTSYDNPGWDDLVVNVLGSIAQLVGKKAQHVPQVKDHFGSGSTGSGPEGNVTVGRGLGLG